MAQMPEMKIDMTAQMSNADLQSAIDSSVYHMGKHEHGSDMAHSWCKHIEKLAEVQLSRAMACVISEE